MLPVVILGILCAGFGVFAFNSKYTCKIVKWNNKLKKWCVNLAWIPSALCVMITLGMALWKSSTGPLTPLFFLLKSLRSVKAQPLPA